MTSYSPAEAAEKSGFTIDTLRYYERIGLLPDIARDAGGRRVYSEGDLNWLGMLRCLRESGMPIAEMLRYTELSRAGDHTVPERVELLRRHDARVEEKIARLREQCGQLQFKIGFYTELVEADPPGDAAPAGAGAAVV
ncbi:MerR family transcriptional regulator [Actinomadura sp. SCN-SB]|uniref:MerR family transcriptional regulator n=1 Tax=Actinomadura sp. SCN-SB TaxID=3373092 RepID=UPI00375041FA